MLRSLKKLRNGNFAPKDSFYVSKEETYKLADEIQMEVDDEYVPVAYGSLDAYIDRWCVRRPLYDDGTPVQFGGLFYDSLHGAHIVQEISYDESGDVRVFDHEGYCAHMKDGRLERPPEETQRRIDHDSTLDPFVYCAKYGIELGDEDDVSEMVEKMVAHILKRQRRLDEME